MADLTESKTELKQENDRLRKEVVSFRRYFCDLHTFVINSFSFLGFAFASSCIIACNNGGYAKQSADLTLLFV